jgi:MYXO-CTERM domain-containing protein
VQNQFLQEGALTATNDVWNLGANGVLTYTGTTAVAAVPETNTWAMALLGLGFMGFVARRRA